MKMLFAFLLVIFFACNSKKVYREISRTEVVDPEIILFDIGNSNRAEIADLLLKIDKCRPLVMGIDLVFSKTKEKLEDSIFASALEMVSKDILAYKFDSTGKEARSIGEFGKFASDEGYADLDIKEELSSHFIPIKEIDGKLYESFALKIFRKWKPEFKYDLTVNKSIPILFQRSLKQYYEFVKTDLLDKNVCDFLKDKIILVGFLGPGNDDKKFTPMRGNDKEHVGQPDTYDLVIQANAIRTILEYEKKD